MFFQRVHDLCRLPPIVIPCQLTLPFLCSRAHPVPSLEKEDESTSSLVDVDSPHVQSVSNDFENAEVKTKTQADRLGAEASTEAQKVRDQASGIAKDAKKKASVKGKNAKDQAKEDWDIFKANSDNPVVVGNLIIWAVGAAAIGFAGYQRYSEGKLDWKVAGFTAGAVGAFATADYFGSQ